MLTPKYGIPVAGGADDSDQSAVAAISQCVSGRAAGHTFLSGVVPTVAVSVKPAMPQPRPTGNAGAMETRHASQAGKDFPERMSADDQFTEYGERRQ
jgi:hypothetical protein